MADLDRTIKWINKTGKNLVISSTFSLIIYSHLEGRDKFCKCIQYGSRFLMWSLQNKDKENSDRFKAMFSK